MTSSFVAVFALALVGLVSGACSHPGGGGVFTGSAGTTGAGGNGSPVGTAGTSGSAGTSGGGAGTTGSAGDVGTTGTAGTGAGGDTSPTGTAGTVGTLGDAGATGTAGSGAAGATGTAGTSGSGGAGTTGTGGSGSGINLIANGDFSSGATNWHTESGTGNVNGSGAYCVSNPGAALIGWDAPAGSPLMLMGGKSYRISYQASGAGSMHLKIGMAAQPYGDIYTADDALSSSLQTFTHNFTPTATNNAGLAFTFSNAGTGMVCLDDVTLTAN